VRRSPVETVLTSVVSALRASTGLTALVSSTGVYNNVEQGASFPYVAVTSPSDRRVDTFGRFGSELVVNTQVVSQARGDKEASQILDQVIRALNFATLATTQHTALGITWDNSDRYMETINGVPTRYHIGMFRVWTEQSSS
jgi:hypothetical protein